MDEPQTSRGAHSERPRPSGHSDDTQVQQDFADNLPDLVEGHSELGTPTQPAQQTQQSQDGQALGPDRSDVIGKDARILAGWALRFIVVIVAAYIFFRLLGSVWVGLLPVIMALLLSTVLWPPTRMLRNLKWPAALAALTTLVVFFLAFIGIFAAMAPVISSQGQRLVDQAREGIDQIISWLQGPPLNLNVQDLNLDEMVSTVTDFLRQQSGNIASGVFSGVSTVSSVLVTVFITAMITFFILKDGDKFLPMVRRYTGSKAGWHLSEALTRTWQTLSGFIQTQALVSFIDALFIGIGLLILQVPMAFILAVITFFAGFIPIVGAFTAGALAVIIALVTNGITNALLVLALIVLVQQLEGNILQPILQSKAMNLHAAVVLLSVMVGSALFGIAGAFLAVPVAASIGVWIRYHAEMVSLRAGEITVDDIEIATAKGQNLSSREAFLAVSNRLKSIATRQPTGGSTAASKMTSSDIAEEATSRDRVHDADSADPGEGRER